MNQDLRDHRVKEVHQEREVAQVNPVHLGHLDPVGLVDHVESVVRLDPEEKLDQVVNQVLMVVQDEQENVDNLDHPAQLENLVDLDPVGHLAHEEKVVPEVNLEHQAQMDNQDHQVHKLYFVLINL